MTEVPASETAKPFHRLLAFALAMVLSVSALLPWPTLFAPGPVMALAFYLMASALVVRPDLAPTQLMARTLRSGVWWILAGTLLLGLGLYWPVTALQSGGTLAAVLIAGAVLGLAWIWLWRHASALALWLQDDAVSPLTQLHELGDSILLGRRAWLAALALLLLALSSLSLAWRALWPDALYPIVLLVYTVLLAPLLAYLAVRWTQTQLNHVRQDIADQLADLATAKLPARRREQILDLDAALYSAARAGRIDEALELLESGANAQALPAPTGRDQRSLPMLACVHPDLRLLRALIVAGVDLNRSHAGITPLFAAVRDSYHGRPDAVLTLVTNGADPRATTAEGATALHAAARNADAAIAALLLDAGAELDALDLQGISALGIAAGQGNLAVARFLLERRAHCEPAGGEPAILLAATREDDDTAMLALLLRHKARVDARGRLGRTALHGACLHRNPRMVEALLAAKAKPDAADDNGVTPLHEAARAGAVACVALLAARGGFDPAARDNGGRNALAIACQSGACDSATVKALLALGVDPQQAANDGKRAIDHAVAAGRWAHVALLDPHYVLPACLTEDDEELADIPLVMRLRLALERGSLSHARDLLAVTTIDPAELASLYLAMAPGMPLASARLLAAPLGQNPHTSEGHALLWQLLAMGPSAQQALTAMLERGVSAVGRGSLARYLEAARVQESRHPDAQAFALELFWRGADPFAGDGGDPPLHLAIHLSWTRIVDALLERGIDPDSRDHAGATALMLACQRNDEAMVQCLIAWGAQPTCAASDGRTAKGMALVLDHPALQRWMTWPNWHLPKRRLRDDDLVAAARAGDEDAVQRLLELGLHLDATDAQGCSALLRACGGGHEALVRQLLARGARIDIVAHSGATCLSVALTARQLGVVRVLADAGVDCNQRLPGGATPLMIAAVLGLDEAIEILLDHSADPWALDEQGSNVLHALAQYGFGADRDRALLASWELLLDAGADADVINQRGETPLLLVLGASFDHGAERREELVLAQVERLLRHGISLGGSDRRGFGPLHLAALHGMGTVLRRLLAAGADPNARDSINRRPAEIALMLGYVDLASAFAPKASTPSLARFLRDPGGSS
ncbi:MAG TPA: ankyrin repeat domain-containing protein [Chiayiivirga sp.]|nr:ankyrin repeat domain-containing protein [Chiayiivirga sp.]